MPPARSSRLARLAASLALLAVSRCAVGAADVAWTVDAFPNPVTNPEACGRAGVNRSW